MTSMASDETASWKILTETKEKEWRISLESRVEFLETSLKDKDKELQCERLKFAELKEHFKYNFKLLDERDKELEKYDSTYSDIKSSLCSKNAEISELKIQIDDLKGVIKREDKSREELQSVYQRRLREKQAEVDSYKSNKDGELQEERKEYEEFRRNLQLQLTNLQNELDTQKNELTTEFENELKKREHEFKVQSDELNAKVLEHQLKAKLLERELELARDTTDKSCSLAKDAEQSQRQLEKVIKQKEWELADSNAIKDSKISELEHKVSTCEGTMKSMQEDFQRKYTEMDKISREREEIIERAKNGYLEREKVLQEANQALNSKLEDGLIRERQLDWKLQDLARDKEMQIEKLQEEVGDVKEKWERHVSEISRENVARDLELSTALEEQRRLKLDLEQRKNDIDRYKNELKASAEREEKLDKAKAQSELDWQRRCEELENIQYDKSEDLIKKLTVARNEAQALVKERERELQHKIYLIKSLHNERDQLRGELKKHNIPLHNFVKYSVEKEREDEDFTHIEHLQKQNESLKQLIKQMRSEMESLGHIEQNTSSNAIDYESGQQTELQNLKKENQNLKDRLKVDAVSCIGNNDQILNQVEGNMSVKNHILALNESIGILRSEKVELSATVKKQQAKLVHLETSLENLSTQPRQKQIEIEQLNYSLTTERRRHAGEVSGLQSRLSELELQVSEARREADEYHRVSLERNQELVSLGNQLSSLKLEMSEANPSVNYGAQELYIQQLQSELSQLRKRATALDGGEVEKISAQLDSGKNLNNSDAKYKLKSAAAKIVQLAKENQQLIESNNRLRAQLKNSDFINNQKSTIEDIKKVQEKNSSTTDFDGRLSQLEKLQYELTRQELQYAHKFNSDIENSKTERVQPVRDFDGISNSQNNQDGFPPSRQNIDGNMLMSMSSGGGESIQKVWQMLDESVTTLSAPPSPRSELNNQSKLPKKSSLKKSFEDQNFHLKGNPAVSDKQERVPQVGRSAALKYAEKVRKTSHTKPKVRNYNFTDDSTPR